MARKTLTPCTRDSETSYGIQKLAAYNAVASCVDRMWNLSKDELAEHGRILADYAATGHGKDGLPVRDIRAVNFLLTEAREIYRERFLNGKQSSANPEPVATPEPAPRVSGNGWDGEIVDGTYTVVFEDGEYRTLKVKTQPDDATFKPGSKIISYLNGPDNWQNYKSFGEVKRGNQLYVWHKHRTDGMVTIIDAAMALLAGPESIIDGLKAYGHESGTCGVCGRKLTVPESIERGIGPECWGKLGM
jgi:hypothetical protein